MACINNTSEVQQASIRRQCNEKKRFDGFSPRRIDGSCNLLRQRQVLTLALCRLFTKAPNRYILFVSYPPLATMRRRHELRRLEHMAEPPMARARSTGCWRTCGLRSTDSEKGGCLEHNRRLEQAGRITSKSIGSRPPASF